MFVLYQEWITYGLRKQASFPYFINILYHTEGPLYKSPICKKQAKRLTSKLELSETPVSTTRVRAYKLLDTIVSNTGVDFNFK